MPVTGLVAAPNVCKVMTEGRAFGSAASAASLRIGAGRVLPVVTGMANHNAVDCPDKILIVVSSERSSLFGVSIFNVISLF